MFPYLDMTMHDMHPCPVPSFYSAKIRRPWPVIARQLHRSMVQRSCCLRSGSMAQQTSVLVQVGEGV